jgi:hypothetical protein
MCINFHYVQEHKHNQKIKFSIVSDDEFIHLHDQDNDGDGLQCALGTTTSADNNPSCSCNLIFWIIWIIVIRLDWLCEMIQFRNNYFEIVSFHTNLSFLFRNKCFGFYFILIIVIIFSILQKINT